VAGLTLKASERVLVLIFGLATMLYLVQMFTPLRLTTDGISYLSFGVYGSLLPCRVWSIEV